MATWDAVRVSDIVEDIHDGRVVLPVIQRRLVWKEAKMELLFDSLLRGNSFGGIMVLQETQANEPLFAFRRFSLHGEELASALQAKLPQKTLLVIDGQQRLQAFYMGLRGGINNKQLYFNLLGCDDEFEFRFAYQETDLPAQEPDDGGTAARKLWYHVPTLFDRLQMVQSDKQVANEIAAEGGITDGVVKDAIENSVSAFFLSTFVWKAIGLSSVMVNKTQIDRERQRIVELFRRLNDGGTRLSSFDLAASRFKGFDERMESFFSDVGEFGDVGIGQDEVIKLIFLLQDSHTKEVTDIEASDAKFVIDNRERIIVALQALRTFLKNAKLYDYYQSGGRSVIPLYFVAYHIYHKMDPTAQLAHCYDNYDAKNEDFLSLKRWMYLSILNGTFSRGVGWIPYLTGIRKILNALKAYKRQVFPCQALFQIYRDHPLRFSEEIVPDRIDLWDRDVTFYLMYGCQSQAGRDIDHVHPKSKLDSAGVEPRKIHSIANLQLLDKGTNRIDKRAKTLAGWLKGDGASPLEDYLKKHLIPKEEPTWEIEGFDAFLEKRTLKIVDKVRAAIPAPVSHSPVPPPQPPLPPPPQKGTARIDRAALRDQLTSEQGEYQILQDTTTWHDVYKAHGLKANWTSRYRNKLASVGIELVADFALFIMALGLEFCYSYEWGNVFRFDKPAPDGQVIVLDTRSFGGWAWSTALNELKARGFDWKAFVVNPEQLPE